MGLSPENKAANRRINELYFAAGPRGPMMRACPQPYQG
jgi:hypothetical protein